MTRAVVGVDVGGTFTDVALHAGGDLVTAKVPTTDDESVGVLAGVEKAAEAAGVDPAAVDGFAHATTVAVNALLEGTVATTGLVTTEGFRDVLEIGRQDRPSLYDVDAEKPPPLVPRRRRFAVPERTTVEGVETPVDLDAVEDVAATLREADVDAVAVAFLHVYADPANERRAAGRLREALDAPVSASHEVDATFREYERTATTVTDASLRPTVEDYLARLADRARTRGLPDPDVMQASGGVVDAEAARRRPVTTVLSGPAAGVVGAAAAVRGGEADGLVTFDMGGTSADVSLVRDGRVERTTAIEVGGRPIRVPAVDVETVGAGGGSVARVDDGGALRVGPESAGAAPGPACYGRGGAAPTVTDAAVVLGYVGPGARLGGELAVDEAAARDALASLAASAGLDGPVAAAEGVARVTTANLARAVRAVTVERGHDPRRFGLVAFGGAGPMFAASLAARLDVDRVFAPRASGVLSAYGLLAADETRDAARTYRVPLGECDPDAVESVYESLAAEVRDAVSDPGAAAVTRRAECRYAGQSFELEVPVDAPFDPAAVASAFHDRHERAYGYRLDDPATLVNCRITATVERTPPAVAAPGGGGGPTDRREVVFGGEAHETAVYGRETLAAGQSLDAPAVVEGTESTAVVPPGWAARVADDGTLCLRRER
ncbi:MAG: hydantoinase/oxoprolinase family protein [Halobacteriaceae archaeon]